MNNNFLSNLFKKSKSKPICKGEECFIKDSFKEVDDTFTSLKSLIEDTSNLASKVAAN